MIVLANENTYGFPNATIQVFDETLQTAVNTTSEVVIPDFNILVPIVVEQGMTNVVELFQPGDYGSYVANHGAPNVRKFGFGPNFIYEVLSRGQSGVGVYTVNLRGPTASIANVMVSMKWRVENNVPYLDGDGNQYYYDPTAADPAATLTTDPIGEAIKRDVLHIKFVTSSKENLKKWPDMYAVMEAAQSDTPDEDGYRTIPCFTVVYNGASSFGNGLYFSMTPVVSEFDNNMYYRLLMFNGERIVSTDSAFSFDMDAGAAYDQNYYIEHVFNAQFPNMRYITAMNNQDMVELIEKYLFTVGDLMGGTADKPSIPFSAIDPFSAIVASDIGSGVKNTLFAVQVDEDSVDPTLTNAFQLSGGYDGAESRDELFRMFFGKEIITDLNDPIRYRVPYIVDIGYDDDTKNAISDLCTERNYMTRATLMLGEEDGFASAIRDRQYKWNGNRPHIRELAKCQSPMFRDRWTGRTFRFPGAYFDTIALMDWFIKWGNYFQPFAGADARWSGYIEGTMPYPAANARELDSLNKSRINAVMKDAQSGAYLNDQMMATSFWSDQTEMNNAFLVSMILYDFANLIHRNHFKFNEDEDIRLLQEKVNSEINAKYKSYAAELSFTVSKQGNVGRAKATNEIIAEVNLKDIWRWTNLRLYIKDGNVSATSAALDENAS